MARGTAKQLPIFLAQMQASGTSQHGLLTVVVDKQISASRTRHGNRRPDVLRQLGVPSGISRSRCFDAQLHQLGTRR